MYCVARKARCGGDARHVSTTATSMFAAMMKSLSVDHEAGNAADTTVSCLLCSQTDELVMFDV